MKSVMRAVCPVLVECVRFRIKTAKKFEIKNKKIRKVML